MRWLCFHHAVNWSRSVLLLIPSWTRDMHFLLQQWCLQFGYDCPALETFAGSIAYNQHVYLEGNSLATTIILALMLRRNEA